MQDSLFDNTIKKNIKRCDIHILINIENVQTMNYVETMDAINAINVKTTKGTYL